jgi:hypothetical protein
LRFDESEAPLESFRPGPAGTDHTGQIAGCVRDVDATNDRLVCPR